MNLKLDKKIMEVSLKIALGSSLALFIAEYMELQNAGSAGTIALLTIVTTKWETFQLSLARIITYGMSVAVAFIVYQLPFSRWVIYGIYLLVIVSISIGLKWRSTISINSVIGIHFLNTGDFSTYFIKNEFLLVLIGILVAFVINMFPRNKYHKRRLVINMRETEERLQLILGELGRYLRHEERKEDVWTDIKTLESSLMNLVLEAGEYEGNTFHKHTCYYMDYFEMRLEQCNVLEDLHVAVNKIREMPEEAKIIADFIDYLVPFVVEKNTPAVQIERLEDMMEAMKQSPLPQSYEELEKRAILYHVQAELETFLMHKKRFVDKLDINVRELYWEKQ